MAYRTTEAGRARNQFSTRRIKKTRGPFEAKGSLKKELEDAKTALLPPTTARTFSIAVPPFPQLHREAVHGTRSDDSGDRGGGGRVLAADRARARAERDAACEHAVEIMCDSTRFVALAVGLAQVRAGRRRRRLFSAP